MNTWIWDLSGQKIGFAQLQTLQCEHSLTAVWLVCSLEVNPGRSRLRPAARGPTIVFSGKVASPGSANQMEGFGWMEGVEALEVEASFPTPVLWPAWCLTWWWWCGCARVVPGSGRGLKWSWPRRVLGSAPGKHHPCSAGGRAGRKAGHSAEGCKKTTHGPSRKMDTPLKRSVIPAKNPKKTNKTTD